MSDLIPIIVVGAALTIVITRWVIHNRTPQQIRNNTRSLDQLVGMFPNIPPTIIRTELARSGSTQAAIEHLLAISSNFPSPTPIPSRNEPPTKSTVSRLLQEEPTVVVQDVDKETWSKDAKLREQMLIQKKQEMIRQARKFLLLRFDLALIVLGGTSKRKKVPNDNSNIN